MINVGNEMKVLIVNTSDIIGGAAKAAYRLHRALLSQNINSQMLVQDKSGDDYTVLSEANKIKKYINKLRPLIDSIPVRFYKNNGKTLFSPSWLGFNNIIKRINEINPDIVHVHWVAGGMMRIEDIAKINAPIVWSLHDMWAFTGGCHYDEFCANFKNDCLECKVLSSVNCRLSSKGLSRRKYIYNKIRHLRIVPTSYWIKNQATDGFAAKYIDRVLYNPLDTSLFKKFPKQAARNFFNIGTDKKVILFGSIGVSSDKRKGFEKLLSALSLLKTRSFVLLIVGSTKPKDDRLSEFNTLYIPALRDEISLPLIYNVADVTVTPSLQETFGQISSESLACETPVVGFFATGTADIVDHKINGYLAKPFDVTDLANGIDWVLNNNNYNDLCKNAREKVIREFSSDIVAKKYIELYQEIINDAK